MAGASVIAACHGHAAGGTGRHHGGVGGGRLVGPARDLGGENAVSVVFRSLTGSPRLWRNPRPRRRPRQDRRANATIERVGAPHAAFSHAASSSGMARTHGCFQRSGERERGRAEVSVRQRAAPRCQADEGVEAGAGDRRRTQRRASIELWCNSIEAHIVVVEDPDLGHDGQEDRAPVRRGANARRRGPARSPSAGHQLGARGRCGDPARRQDTALSAADELSDRGGPRSALRPASAFTRSAGHAAMMTRRDFLNGTALTIAAGLAPGRSRRSRRSRSRYPPALTGLRGQHDGSFEAAHALRARGHARFAVDGCRSRSATTWSWSAAASAGWRRPGSIAAPPPGGAHPRPRQSRRFRRPRQAQRVHDRWPPAHRLRRQPVDRLARYPVERRRPRACCAISASTSRGSRPRSSAGSIPRSGSSRGLFLARESFGRDALVAGEPPSGDRRGRAPPRQCAAARRVRRRSADRGGEQGAAPRALRRQRAIRSPARPPRRSCGSQEHELPRLSHQGLRLQRGGGELLPGPHARLLRARLRCSAGGRPARHGLSGLRGLGLPAASARAGEPYIYHFPDGNASLARLLVRALFPGVASGRTMEDVVLAPFDYDRLDGAPSRSHPARFDLHRRTQRGRQGRCSAMCAAACTHRVEARHAVLACFHMVIPHLMPELPAPQREALAQNVKTPIVYTNVVVRNWRPWLRLKVSTSPRRCRFTPGVARLPGQPRRLSPSARSVRADLPASRARCGRAQPGPRRARPSSASASRSSST